jgi:hypothetical protein
VPRPGTDAASRLEQRLRAASVHPLYQLARIQLYLAFNVLGLWFWLRFGTETYRTVPLWPFGLAFVLLLTSGLGLYWCHHPLRPRPATRAWWAALAVGALCGGVLVTVW